MSQRLQGVVCLCDDLHFPGVLARQWARGWLSNRDQDIPEIRCHTILSPVDINTYKCRIRRVCCPDDHKRPGLPHPLNWTEVVWSQSWTRNGRPKPFTIHEHTSKSKTPTDHRVQELWQCLKGLVPCCLKTSVFLVPRMSKTQFQMKFENRIPNVLCRKKMVCKLKWKHIISNCLAFVFTRLRFSLRYLSQSWFRNNNSMLTSVNLCANDNINCGTLEIAKMSVDLYS